MYHEDHIPWYRLQSKQSLAKAKAEAGITPPTARGWQPPGEQKSGWIHLPGAKEKEAQMIREKLMDVLSGRFLNQLPAGKR